MKHLLLALIVVAVPAQAFDWPWQNQERENYSYCKGFVSAGLGALPVKDLSRIRLWLSWNHVVNAQLEQGNLDEAQYDAGKTRFSTLLAANDLESLQEVADSDCDFGPV